MHEARPFKFVQLLATNGLICKSFPYKYERLIPKPIFTDITISLRPATIFKLMSQEIQQIFLQKHLLFKLKKN